MRSRDTRPPYALLPSRYDIGVVSSSAPGSRAPNFRLADLPPIPQTSFAVAYLGAYFYVLKMLVRRYFQGDLKSTGYINGTMRIIRSFKPVRRA
jgi:hypothetical protein